MSDLISRQKAIEAIKELCEHYTPTKSVDHPHMNFVIEELQKLPSVQPEIIRCKDCEWWDKEDDMPLGYCRAIKHGFYSRNWEISIRRKYPEDFFCADAELRGD